MKASLRQGLTRWLLPSLFLALLMGALCAYAVARYAAALAYDEALMAAAEDFALGVHDTAEGLRFALSSQSSQILATDARDKIYFAVRTQDGTLIGGDAGLIQAPIVKLGGGTSVESHFDGAPIHALSMQFDQFRQPVIITVAETLNKREAMARSILFVLLGPAVLVLALAGLLVWFAVGKGLQPLDILRGNIESRSASDLSPIALGEVPEEVRSLVASFNQLLERLDETARAQQGFVADVAHQLRTPLAGLQTLIELLPRLQGAEFEAALLRLQVTVTRAIRLSNQLLLLSRANRELMRPERTPLDLKHIVEDAADDWVHRAIATGIDLGFELHSAPVTGDDFLLHEVMDNVVDNALRYAGAGASVTVSTGSITDGKAIFAVDDSGPGIPAQFRHAVLDRFFRMPDARGEGSGLGLAIVEKIAQLHEGQVHITDSTMGGARVSIELPLQRGVP